MKLYGFALAAVPEQPDGHTFKMTGTPIAIENGERENVIIEPGAFKNEIINVDDFETLTCFFIRLVHLLETLVIEQRASLAAAGLPYRPVALMIGEDGRKPVHLSTFLLPLFNRAALGRTDTKISEENKKTMQARTEFFISHPQIFAEFKKSCMKLAGLLIDNVLFVKGSYGNYSSEDRHTQEELEKSEKNLSEINSFLLEQKSLLSSNSDTALQTLIEMAKGVAEHVSSIYNELPTAFKVHVPFNPNDLEMRARNPYYFFYEWHPSIRQAFYDTLKPRLTTPFYRHIKLACDPSFPPFVDPAADIICHVFEVLKGRRKMEDANDNLVTRYAIAAAARLSSQQQLTL